MRDNKVDLSVVLPSYNDFNNFKKSYLSILSQIENNDEIIIVDSSSIFF